MFLTKLTLVEALYFLFFIDCAVLYVKAKKYSSR